MILKGSFGSVLTASVCRTFHKTSLNHRRDSVWVELSAQDNPLGNHNERTQANYTKVRSFSGPATRNVLDAVGLSPAQIKRYLDNSGEPWSQETEDKFRGVDGRKVIDQQALYHPPEKDRPKKMTEEEVGKRNEYVKEYNKKVVEEWERREREGIPQDEMTSNYDLGPKKTS